MFRCLRLAAASITLCLAAAAAPAQTTEDAVRQAAQDLLDSWREADAAKGDAVLHPDFRLATRRDNFASDDTERRGPLPSVDVASRAQMMALYANLSPGAWDDRLSDIVVHADPSGIATLWARYRFHMDGRLTHCGIVTLILYEQDGRWRIVEFADTHHWAEPGEPDGCAPPSTRPAVPPR